MKRYLALFLSLVMILCALPLAIAEDVENPYEDDGIVIYRDADGNVVLNYTDADIAATGSKHYIVQERAFQKYFVLEGLDVYLPGNPAYSSYIINDLFTTNMKTWESNATFAPTDYNLTNTKNEAYYSFRSAVINNIRDIIIQAVISDNPETVWNDFVNEHREEGDKLAAELTEEFLK